MTLDILVPQYNETDSVIKQLLDSIAIQQNIDFEQVVAHICNDGSQIFLSDELLKSYPFKIHYYRESHKGVSATRNFLFDHSDSEYVMFCDADDIFYNACGLYIISEEAKKGTFDVLVSAFVEETHDTNGKIYYLTHQVDSTFVHGKVYNRKFLTENNIRWRDELKVHEDSYFNCLAQKVAKDAKYCPTSFYLWKWRDESVCRHDASYILKTYKNMIYSNDCLVAELMRRNLHKEAVYYVITMIYDAYYSFNCKEWIDLNNQSYREETEKEFSRYYSKYETFYETSKEEAKLQINCSVRQRFFAQGLMFEEITFKDWIDHIRQLH